MANGIIVGKETKTFPDKNTGEIKTFRTLYILWDTPRRPEDGFMGQKVQTENISFAIDDLKVGDYCMFDYDIRATKTGTYARLADVDVLGHVDLSGLKPKN